MSIKALIERKLEKGYREWKIGENILLFEIQNKAK